MKHGDGKRQGTLNFISSLANDTIRQFFDKQHENGSQEVVWAQDVHKVGKKTVIDHQNTPEREREREATHFVRRWRGM